MVAVDRPFRPEGGELAEIALESRTTHRTEDKGETGLASTRLSATRRSESTVGLNRATSTGSRFASPSSNEQIHQGPFEPIIGQTLIANRIIGPGTFLADVHEARVEATVCRCLTDVSRDKHSAILRVVS